MTRDNFLTTCGYGQTDGQTRSPRSFSCNNQLANEVRDKWPGEDSCSDRFWADRVVPNQELGTKRSFPRGSGPGEIVATVLREATKVGDGQPKNHKKNIRPCLFKMSFLQRKR